MAWLPIPIWCIRLWIGCVYLQMTEVEHRLFVSNLAATISEAALVQRFKAFGKVSDVKLHSKSSDVPAGSWSAHLSLLAKEESVKKCLLREFWPRLCLMSLLRSQVWACSTAQNGKDWRWEFSRPRRTSFRGHNKLFHFSISNFHCFYHFQSSARERRKRKRGAGRGERETAEGNCANQHQSPQTKTSNGACEILLLRFLVFISEGFKCPWSIKELSQMGFGLFLIPCNVNPTLHVLWKF